MLMLIIPGLGNWSKSHSTNIVAIVLLQGRKVLSANSDSLPPNVIFQIDDIEEPWAFSHKFEFIHSRMMTGSIASWPKFFDNAYEWVDQFLSTQPFSKPNTNFSIRNLSPGGYIELTDVFLPVGCDDGTLTPDHSLHQWSELVLSASVKIGRPINSAKGYKAQMEHAGFTDVNVAVDLWPTNKWPKDPKYKELGTYSSLLSPFFHNDTPSRRVLMRFFLM